jgi:hypothetical protein
MHVCVIAVIFDSNTHSSKFHSSFRHKFDKENVHHHHHHHQPAAASFTGGSPKATLVVKPTPLTPKTAFLQTLSPVTSPTLLQQNLSQMSLMTSDSPAARRRLSENNSSQQQQQQFRVLTPTRMLDQGAARCVNPAAAPSHKNSATGTPRRHRVVKCRRLRGSPGGGTPDQSWASSSSPSFVLLQDPSSPDPQNTSQFSESSAYSLMAELSMDCTPTRPSPNMERSDCINPVAFTLWRGGHEDREWLQEQDRMATIPRYPSPRQQYQQSAAASYSGAFSPSPASSTASSSRRAPAPPRQVSNNLRDVYGANYSREISRPIPMMARRRDDFYY